MENKKRKQQAAAGGGKEGKGKDGAEGGGGATKKRKGGHSWHPKQKKPFSPDEGHKGVLVTCARNRESECVHEMFNLLNEYADIMYPDEDDQGEAGSSSSTVADALAKELAALQKEQKEGKRRFYCLDTRVKGVLLIRFADDRIQPVPFVRFILADLKKRGEQKTRFAVRMIPIEKTCPARLEKIVATIEELVPAHFPTEGPGKQYSIIFKSRHNDVVARKDCIPSIARLIPKPPHTVNLSNPQAVIIIEIFQKACGVSIASNGEWPELDEFNIRNISMPKQDKPKQQQTPKKDTKEAEEEQEEKEDDEEEKTKEEEPSGAKPTVF